MIRKLSNAFIPFALVSMLLGASAASAGTSYSVGLVSDYRFRGISQNWGDPALQAGVESAGDHWYGGLWTSQVSDDMFYDGSMEVDLYFGYRGGDEVKYDLGVLRYVYPGAEASFTDAPAVDPDKFDTTEIYAGMTYGMLNVKYSRSVGDYFGINNAFTQNVGICANRSGAPGNCDTAPVASGRGGSSGSQYIELNLTKSVEGIGDFSFHAGSLTVENYDELDMSDFKVAWSRGFSWATLSLAYHFNSTEDGFYTLTDRDVEETEVTDESGVVLGISKSF